MYTIQFTLYGLICQNLNAKRVLDRETLFLRCFSVGRPYLRNLKIGVKLYKGT